MNWLLLRKFGVALTLTVILHLKPAMTFMNVCILMCRCFPFVLLYVTVIHFLLQKIGDPVMFV